MSGFTRIDEIQQAAYSRSTKTKQNKERTLSYIRIRLPPPQKHPEEKNLKLKKNDIFKEVEFKLEASFSIATVFR